MNIRQWTIAASREPDVRIGVILDEDAYPSVRIRLAGQHYRAEGAGATTVELEPGTEVAVKRAEPGLVVQIAGRPELRVESLRLSYASRTPDTAATQSVSAATRSFAHRGAALEPGAGAIVHDIVAGRGFHWQRRIDQTLTGTLELRCGRRGVVLVNELPLEEYLAGVITAEMSGACPAHLLMAQCIVARSWLLAMTEPKHEGEPFERCNDDCCQRYQGTGDLSAAALEAVRRTRGAALLTPVGGVLDANYSKSCGGISETAQAVWGVDKPGIVAVVDAPPDAPERRFLPITASNLDDYLDGGWLGRTQIYCSPNAVPREAIGKYLGRVDVVDEYFRWTVRYTRAELEELLREKLPQLHAMETLRGLRVVSRGVSGRANIVEVEWAGKSGASERTRLESEYLIRKVLHRKFLFSSAFAVRREVDEEGRLSAVTLRGAGWGHGAGMCQIGALGMALSGIDYETICRHYYPTARLATVYP